MKEFTVFTKDGLFSAVCILDDDDYEHFSLYPMFIERTVSGNPAYVVVKGYYRKPFPRLHRILGVRHFSVEKGQEIDHIDRNRFNNIKSNLRVATRRQNLINRPARGARSQYKGVIKEGSVWRALFYSSVLASFKEERLAAICYDLSASERYGEFHKLNIPNPTDEEIDMVKKQMVNTIRRPKNKKYPGVYFNKRSATWSFFYKKNGKRREKYGFLSEIQAYLELEMFMLCFGNTKNNTYDKMMLKRNGCSLEDIKISR